MKKIIIRTLGIVCLIGMLVTLILNISIEVVYEIKDFERVSGEYFYQIENVLADNEKKLEQIKKDFAKVCIVRARAAAYITCSNPDIIENQERCKEVAALLQVDELHFLNTSGIIYAGTHPEYYGLDVNSGEQIGFFAAMLDDYSLELCQDITPNTAEEKMMQYAAVWCQDQKRIVQVGLKPERVLEAIEGNNISDLFAMISCERDSHFFAVDRETNEILGSTDAESNGKSASEIGLNVLQATEELTSGYQNVNGERQYCVAKQSGDLILVHICPVNVLFERFLWDIVLLCIYIISLFVILVSVTCFFLDRRIIRSIVNINKQLKRIEQGNYEIELSDNSTREFAELCQSINSMTGSLLNFPRKVSKALELSGIPIGICEYEAEKNKLTTTSRVQDMLLLTEEECEQFRKHPERIEAEKNNLFCREANMGEHVYSLRRNPSRYIRIEVFNYKKSKIIVLIDVSANVLEKCKLTAERDTDLLTGLYNRRAFFRIMDTLFESPEIRKNAVLVMFDLDNLKMVNDVYGHTSGDNYLGAFSEELQKCSVDNKVATRMGGDEFALFVYGLEDEDPKELMERLLAFRDTRMVTMENGEKQPLEFSAGWVLCTQEDLDYLQLIRLADKRMYENKAERKEKCAKGEIR